MNNTEAQYLALVQKVLNTGEKREDRTGVGTIALFGEQLRFDLSKGFPLLTTKKMPFKSILSELLWFIEGSGDERRLAEILHGSRDTEKKTIWTDNAQAPYWKPKAKFDGDLGRVYGVQWRSWKSAQLISADSCEELSDGAHLYSGATVKEKSIDQLADVIKKLQTNPIDRRMIISAWNPGELDQMALPPCHMSAMFYLSNNRKLSCQMIQRSCDLALGIPFNIASYALLTYMVAHIIQAGVGELIMCLGDTHLYINHLEQVKEQLTRTPYEFPSLHFTRQITSIDDFTMSDLKIENYNHHPAINLSMAV